MTTQLLVFGVLGVLTTAYAFWVNRWLFGDDGAGRVTVLEALFYLVGAVSVGIGWYFNVKYTHHVGSNANYVSYTKALFANWAADSAAQDYIIVNVVLLPLWTVVDGRRRGLRAPWIFFVMAFYLAFVERQVRVARRADVRAAATTAVAAPGRTVAPT